MLTDQMVASAGRALPPQTEPAFDGWFSGVDEPSLRLIRSQAGRVVEWVEIDLRELPDRPDLLRRLSPAVQRRLLADAALLATEEAA